MTVSFIIYYVVMVCADRHSLFPQIVSPKVIESAIASARVANKLFVVQFLQKVLKKKLESASSSVQHQREEDQEQQ